MITALDKPDILDTIRAEGLELRQRGHNFWGLCPFHAEKTPSFKIDPERGSFYCFGCGAKGDTISFVMQLRCLSFIDACKYLGISNGKPSPEALRAIKQQRERAELVRRFRAWEVDYHSELCDLYRTLQERKAQVRTEKDLDRIAFLYHAEPKWIHRLEILEGRYDQAKFELYTEAHGNGS